MDAGSGEERGKGCERCLDGLWWEVEKCFGDERNARLWIVMRMKVVLT